MNMEFLERNYINTTTSVNASAGTSTVSYLFDRKLSTNYTASPTVTIHFTINNTIDRIVFQEINLKAFTIKHVTGTSLFLKSGSDTTTAEFSSNSSTSLYLVLGSITTVNTLTFIGSSAITGGLIQIGQMWMTKNIYELERNPEISDFDIARNRKEYKHKMAGGGTALYTIEEKYFEGRMSWDFISSSATTSLESVYDQKDGIVYVPFPTLTSDWTGQKLAVAYEVVWHGDFRFDLQSDNDRGSGYSGAIRLDETPK